jgi:hypothetical protein
LSLGFVPAVLIPVTHRDVDMQAALTWLLSNAPKLVEKVWLSSNNVHSVVGSMSSSASLLGITITMFWFWFGLQDKDGKTPALEPAAREEVWWLHWS